MIVISDTTPILSLLKAGKLELLQTLYGEILVPEAVYKELISNPAFAEEAAIIASCPFLAVMEVRNKEAVELLRKVTGLDAGESESLILYGEQNADLLIMDEHKGRSIAKKMDVEHIGTMGILMQAFDEGFLSAMDVQESLEKLLSKDIRLSKSLCNRVLKYVGLESKF